MWKQEVREEAAATSKREMAVGSSSSRGDSGGEKTRLNLACVLK